MKTRLVVIFSLIALIIFLLIQFYIIINVYAVRSNEFDSKYKSVLDESMVELKRISPNTGMDSVYFYMEKTGFYSRQLFYREEGARQDSGRTQLVEAFNNIISEHELITDWISYKLDLAGLDKNIESGFRIRNLAILDRVGAIPLIYNDSIIYVSMENQHINYEEKGLLLDKFFVEYNFFTIEYEFYVDFTEKQKIIINELYVVLILISLSVFIVAIVFIFTIRNLMRQKKISDLKSDFINNMTHELKTPLSTISLATQGLANPELLKDKDQVKNLSGIIEQQSKHLTRLIDQILDVSIWEKNEIKLEKSVVDLQNFLKEKFKVFNLDNPEVSYKEFYPEEKIFIEFDEFQITVVLNNLLDNAIKYCKGKLHISLSLEKINNQAIIRFSDNGIGISSENQKMIFSKFFRVDTPLKHNTKGLGLGLFYVKSIIDAHGGTIEVESKRGTGTTFIISLPINS